MGQNKGQGGKKDKKKALKPCGLRTFTWRRRRDLKRQAALHRRIVAVRRSGTRILRLLALGGFAAKKRYIIVFSCYPCRFPSLEFKSSPIRQKKARQPDWVALLFWRRRRDLNSRAGYFRPTPLAGAPLRPT